jgi:DNA-binding NtrC family response regulator
VTTFHKTIREPLGIILPLGEVERRVICDALDKCGGNYLLAARLLGIGKTTVYRKARAYNYQTPKVQGQGLMTVSQDPSFLHRQPGLAHGHK